MFVRVIIVVTLAALITACDQANDGDPIAEPVAYEVMTTSVHLQVEDPHTQVFRNWNEWSAFWAQHPECNSGCVYAPPYVDFETHSVVGVFWGLESHVGQNLAERVESVTRRHEDTFIHLLSGSPTGESLPAFGYADLFLKFEKADGTVQFTGAVPR